MFFYEDPIGMKTGELIQRYSLNRPYILFRVKITFKV